VIKRWLSRTIKVGILDCIHSFFDAYLKGENGSRLKIPSSLYPEIQGTL
jgi:hypothetical protein